MAIVVAIVAVLAVEAAAVADVEELMWVVAAAAELEEVEASEEVDTAAARLAAVGGSRFLKLLEPFCGLSPTSWAAPSCSPPGVAPADLGTFT